MFFLNSCLLLAIIQERKDLEVIYNTDFAITIADTNLDGSLGYLKAAFEIPKKYFPQKSVDGVSTKLDFDLFSLNL